MNETGFENLSDRVQNFEKDRDVDSYILGRQKYKQ